MEKSLRERQIREILDEDILINKRVSELTRLRIRGLTDEGEAIQQGRRNAELESKTSDTISKINGILEAKINDALSLLMGAGKNNPRITHYLNLFNNSALINLYNSVVDEYRKGKNSTQTAAIIQAQFQILDSNISKLINTLAEIINQGKDQDKYLHREILSYSIYDLIQNHIYTNNFSTITEKDIMANIYKVLSTEAAWKADIKAVQLSRTNKNLFTLNEDDVNLIDDIKTQQTDKQEALLIEKANKAKVGNINVFKPRREMYLEKIKEAENDLSQFLQQKEVEIVAIATKYNGGNVLTIAEINTLKTEVDTLKTYVKDIVINTQNPFLQKIKVIVDNTIANNEIAASIEAPILAEIQKITLFTIAPANIVTVMASFDKIKNPPFDYTVARGRGGFQPLKTLIKLCFTDATKELNSIINIIELFIKETLQVDVEITQEIADTDKQIKSYKKFI